MKKSNLPLNLNFSTNSFDNCDIIHFKQEFNVNTENQLSIAVDQLSYIGPHDYDGMCFYGGFAIYIMEGTYDNLSSNAIEALRACWNISSLHRELQKGSSPIYKIGTTINTTSVIFVIYGYAQYSMVQSTIRISETKCFWIYVKISPCPDNNPHLAFTFVITKNQSIVEMTRVLHEKRGGNSSGNNLGETINFPLGACVYLIFANKLDTIYSYTKPFYNLMNIIFRYIYDELMFKKDFFRIWNVETYRTNSSMSSTINMFHDAPPTDTFLFESLLKIFKPMFKVSIINSLLDYCSSPDIPSCSYGSIEAKLENLSFTDPATDRIYSKVTRITQFPKDPDTSNDYLIIQLYPLQTFLYQSFTSVKIYLVVCHLTEWKSHIFNDSLLRHIIDKVCHNQTFNPGSEYAEMYGFSFHQVNSDVIISSNKSVVMKKVHLPMSIFTTSTISERFYFTIFIYSDLSILPDIIGEVVVKRELFGTHKSGVKSFKCSANLTKSKELYIYFHVPTTELSTVNFNSTIATHIDFSFANELKENIDFKIVRNYGYNIHYVAYYEQKDWVDFAMWRWFYNDRNPFCPYLDCGGRGFVSWNEADKKCEQINKTLPSVNSDWELEELFHFNLLMNSKDYSQSDNRFYELVGLYIGLNTNVSMTSLYSNQNPMRKM